MKRNTARGAAVLGRQLVLAALAALVAGLTPGRAAAHDLRADVNPATDPIRVEAGYDDGTPADDARVTVTAADGTVVASGKTDERGVWTFPLPGPGRYTVAVESAGHRDTVGLEVPEAAAPTVFARFRLDKTVAVVLGLALILGGTLLFVRVSRARRGNRPGAT